MGKTLVEKIFSYKMGKNITSNEVHFVPVDVSLGTDGTAPLAIKQFDKMGKTNVVNPDKIILIDDHFSPAKDIASAKLENTMRNFAYKHGIINYFSVGRNGICHVLVPEKRLVKPYEIIVGADSHTCTYGALGNFSTGVGSTDLAGVWATGKAWITVPRTIRINLTGTCSKHVVAKDIILYIIGKLGNSVGGNCCIEFVGKSISEFSISDRLTICNMAVEMGAVSGIMEVDEKLINYYKEYGISIKDLNMKSDEDADFVHVVNIDISCIEPVVAAPYSPANVYKVSELVGTRIDQVVIGSCTNGRIEDFRAAHAILKNKKVNDRVKLIIIPGSQQVLMQMIEENLLLDFIQCGAAICPPTCGPCIGSHMGVLADEEIGLYTTNRNFLARNGEGTTKVYLAGPVVAAVAAVEGSIQSIT